MKTRNTCFSRFTGGFLGGLLCLLLAVLGSSSVIAEKSVTVTYYHTDVLATSDEFGSLEWQRGYQPYGEIQLPRDSNDTDTTTNSLGYTGKPRDASGLVYLGARYYDPLAGRFMAVDPAGVDASNPYSFNRYAYANNNPYKYVDPDGEFPLVAVLWVAIDFYFNYQDSGDLGDAALATVMGMVNPFKKVKTIEKAAISCKSYSRSWATGFQSKENSTNK